MKPRQLALAAALAGAAALVVFGDTTPAPDVAEAVERPAARQTPAAGAAAANDAPAASPASRQRGAPAAGDAHEGGSAIVALLPRAQLIGESGETAFAGADGVFGGQNWNPPPPPPPPAQAPPPPPPPTAPPLPFTFLGKAAADGAWEVFLARADRTYVVRNATVIDGVYRIDKIAPPMLTITYLPLNQIQQLNIGASD